MYFSDKPEGANRNKFKRLLTMLMTDNDEMQAEVSSQEIGISIPFQTCKARPLHIFVYISTEFMLFLLIDSTTND